MAKKNTSGVKVNVVKPNAPIVKTIGDALKHPKKEGSIETFIDATRSCTRGLEQFKEFARAHFSGCVVDFEVVNLTQVWVTVNGVKIPRHFQVL